jgi:hypothetical protein
MQHLHPLTGRCVPSASIWPHARAERPYFIEFADKEFKKH